MNKKVEKLLKVYPLLKGQKKEQALRWLRRNGFFPSYDIPVQQDYKVASPPGPSRLLRIPMYLETLGTGGEGLGYYDSEIITDGGSGTAADKNSTVMFNLSSAKNGGVLDQNNSSISTDNTFGHFIVKSMTFSTRQTPWARMRVIGIEVVSNYVPAVPALPNSADSGNNVAVGIGLAVPPRLLLKNYRVSGSANLFLQDGYIDGTFFDVERYALGGLRAYPILKSPKTLKVDVAISGEHYHGSLAARGTDLQLLDTLETTLNLSTNTDLSFSVNALVDVLDDTSYGAGMEGPYARGINLERIEPPKGQAFIIGE